MEIEFRGLGFNDAKEGESLLRHLISDMDCTAFIEPISGADMFYTDGMASRSNFKIIFKKDSKEIYKVFYPQYYSQGASNIEFDKKINEWVEFIEKVLIERSRKVIVATRTVPKSHPEEMGENGLMWTDVPTKYKKT
jgi:hypothetical protein